MLDDYSQMDKKPNGRQVQPASKAGGTENKKSLDTLNKPFGKNNRRRDPVVYSCPKNELRRKYKGGLYADKRPKPHSRYYNCGKEGSKVAEDEGPEYGLDYVRGRKNWNHLLNFHYSSRVITKSSASSNQSGPQNWFATHKHKYNKEHFLQANCQFVVKQHADYSPHFMDPDLLVDWNFIEQIRLQSNALVSCPICLDIPVAAKITRCGHVYCWSCILHYLALTDKTWRKCPICYEAVHKNDLKSVITLAYSTYNVNEEITFKLMKRERGSLLPIPVEESNRKVVQGLLSLTETEIDTTYSKLLLAKPEDVMSIIKNERMELNNQLVDNEACPEICFIEQALELLKEREELTLKSMEKMEGQNRESAETTAEIQTSEISEKMEAESIRKDIDENLALDFETAMTLQNDEFKRTRHESFNSEGGASESDYPNIAVEDLEITSNVTTKPFYFYQAADGQHVYLHAINIKMLEMQYGSLENCPHQIHGKILEKEGGSMTEGLRKRLRYLQHLPLTCQFEVAEINIAEYVSDEVLESFKGQIEARIRRRNRREREERKRERKINKEVNMIWGMKPEPKLKLESLEQFPLCGSGSEEVCPEFPPSDSGSTGSRRNSLNSLSSVESATLESIFGPPVQSNPSSSLECTGPSFAQMLKEGTARPNSKRHEPSHAFKGEDKESRRTIAPDSEDDLEGYYVPVPNFNDSFRDAIASALEKVSVTPDDTPGNNNNNNNSKKKKKKQRVLFVTGMAYSAK